MEGGREGGQEGGREKMRGEDRRNRNEELIAAEKKARRGEVNNYTPSGQKKALTAGIRSPNLQFQADELSHSAMS